MVLVSQHKQISTQQEAIDGDPYVKILPFFLLRWIFQGLFLSQLSSRERKARLRRENGVKIQGDGPQDKFNVLLLPGSQMIQALILFNVYCIRGCLRRDVFEMPSTHAQLFGKSFQNQNGQLLFSHPKMCVNQSDDFSARRIFSLGDMGRGIHSVIQ